MTTDPKDRIIVPLDVPSVAEARKLVDLLSPHVGLFKIGLELFWSIFADLLLSKEEEAIALLKETRALARAIGGPSAFIDAKLADIPNTVKGASVAISRMKVKMFNIHASVGEEAMRQVVANKGNSLVLAVTVLTSLSERDTMLIYGLPPVALAMRLARIAQSAGVDGIICSPQEIEAMRKAGNDSC